MTTGSTFRISVERLCRIRSETDEEMPFPLTDEGFLDPSIPWAASSEDLVPGALVTPQLAAAAGALVLLGEPGLGKTTVLERLMLPSYGIVTSKSSSVWVDAAELTDATFDEFLGRHLRALPETDDTMLPNDTSASQDSAVHVSNQNLVVVIDQIDESPMVRRLAGRLRNCLRDRDTSRLRVLLACRTADYPSGLTEVLQEVCGACILADLAPLTREQAATLASSADNVSGEALIRASVNVGAGALACVPLTLALLVRLYRRAGVLDARPTELFGQAVTQLLDEHDPDRRGFDTEASVEQRRVVAGRIASWLLLSGRRTIWRGPVLEAGEQDLNADLLASGQEPNLSGPFMVTKKIVTATLGTGLFTGRGENRLAFRHASFAAYLSANYLVNRNVPDAQLKRLFLVAGDNQTSSIPTLLRETAAWLVTLEPRHAEWLVEADPESLLSHSSIVDSNEVKALIVAALLRRASEIELGPLPWARGHHRLEHPGLDAQLLTVLQQAGTREPEDWPSRAKVRLAVRLAGDAGTAKLAEPLLDIADSDAWSTHLRQLAARAAFEKSPQRSASRLRRLLHRFTDTGYADETDPDDELRGELLELLWPEFIHIQEVLRHLRCRRSRTFIGSYFMFERQFSQRLPEADLATVLQWATEQLGSSENNEQSPTQGEMQEHDARPDERPVGRLDTELLEGLVDRVLASPNAATFVDEVARLILRRFEHFDHPPLPLPVDLEDQVGNEPPPVTDLRHALATALIKTLARDRQFTRADAFQIIHDWQSSQSSFYPDESYISDGLRRANRTTLLNAEDFAWAYHAALEAEESGDEILADALAQVAALLLDPADTDSGELAYTNHDNPCWKYLRTWFDPVDLADEAVKLMRSLHGRRNTRPSEPWQETDDVVARINQSLQYAAAGNTDAFWRLAVELQRDPFSRRSIAQFGDNILNFPGIAAFREDPIPALLRAGLEFINKENDYASEWLGTNKYDRRAWAGYLALALLGRHELIEEIDESRWAAWAGAVLWFPAVPVNGGERSLKSKLLLNVSLYATSKLVSRLASYLTRFRE
jgi:hypothetical protein